MTIDEQPPPAKRRQPRGVGRPIRLQERDLDVFRSLSEGRYLTALSIEKLISNQIQFESLNAATDGNRKTRACSFNII